MTYTVTIAAGTIARRYEQTALDDHDVELEAGTYDLEPVRIDGRPTSEEGAYYYRATIPARRVRDGVRFGKAGDPVLYHFRPYAYAVRQPWPVPGFTITEEA